MSILTSEAKTRYPRLNSKDVKTGMLFVATCERLKYVQFCPPNFAHKLYSWRNWARHQEKLKLRQRPPETAIAPHRRQRRHSGGPSYIETWVHRDQIHRHPELVKVAIVIALIVLKVVKVAQSEHNKNAKQFIYCKNKHYYMYITGSLTPGKGEWILRQIGRAGEGGKEACNVLGIKQGEARHVKKFRGECIERRGVSSWKHGRADGELEEMNLTRAGLWVAWIRGGGVKRR
ncbi:hypothetical protein R3P38DRAFT_3376880 [Favolaschia claudopus]|uniref:Uncharacterized protein n=1 Tax=Favolaschia claudopus TaxID=2862362 RepID=A0AAV9ZEB3_9AGAR